MGLGTGGFSVPGVVTSMGRYSQPLLGDIAHWGNPCRRSLVSATGNNSGDRIVVRPDAGVNSVAIPNVRASAAVAIRFSLWQRVIGSDEYSSRSIRGSQSATAWSDGAVSTLGSWKTSRSPALSTNTQTCWKSKLNMMREALTKLDRQANEHSKSFGTVA